MGWFTFLKNLFFSDFPDFALFLFFLELEIFSRFMQSINKVFLNYQQS